jgi:hypothetical protein
MAQEGYAANTFGSNRLGDISEMFIKVVASTVQASLLDPASAPNVSVLTSVGGAYTLQLPKASNYFVDGITPVNTAAKTVGSVTFDYTNAILGFTISGGANLAGAEEIHITFESCSA